jgi:serine/threonine-protein kinase Chk2
MLCPDNLPEKHQKIGDFIVTSHCLGSGSFATVHLAMDREKHRQVACKIIKAKNGREVSCLMKEVHILAAVQHVLFSTFSDVRC